jgi:hypothetical protein
MSGDALRGIKFSKILFRSAAVALVLGGTASSQSHDKILADVGGKKISVSEFLQRSELTIRPDNFKNKNTTLNNLILEKILSLEAGPNDPLASNAGFQARLKGIKEQAMREKLYLDVAFNKATVDTSELKNAYKLSIREYELEFYRMHKALAQKVKSVIDSAPGQTGDVFKYLSEFAGKQPVHKIAYKDPDDDAIHEALFSKPLLMGEVVGPIELSNGEYLVMKVLNWTAYPLLSGIDQQMRWNEVREKERQIKASNMWRSYQSGIMRGKRMEFNGKTFTVLANRVREKYVSEQQKIDSLGSRMPELPFNAKGIDLASPFFTFENKVWTVGDFRNELMSRPLVFRTTNLDSANFNAQFKSAVVDIMRDHCLTREAYKKSLDRTEDVSQTVEMWKDAFVANNQQKNVIDAALKEGKIVKTDAPEILKYWESYMHDLQKKYTGSVTVNVTAFKNISLTKIDMFAVKPGKPYPAVVPDFPTFISSENLDYVARKE